MGSCVPFRYETGTPALGDELRVGSAFFRRASAPSLAKLAFTRSEAAKREQRGNRQTRGGRSRLGA